MRFSARTLLWVGGCAQLLGAAVVVAAARALGWPWHWIVVALGAQTLLVTAGLEALLAAPLERLAARHPLKEGHPIRELASLSDWLTVRAAEERARKRAEKAERRVEAAGAVEERERA